MDENKYQPIRILEKWPVPPHFCNFAAVFFKRGADVRFRLILFSATHLHANTVVRN